MPRTKVNDVTIRDLLVEVRDEIVTENSAEMRRCLDWSGHEPHLWSWLYFCSGEEV